MSPKDEKLSYEQQENNILAQSDAFISLLTKRGILGDSQIDNERIRNAQQEKRRNSFHNTLMLLQHYRTFAWLLECFPGTIAEELEQPFTDLDALLERVDLEMTMGNKKLEGRIEGIKKSRLLMDRVNEALTVLKSKPHNGEKLYNVIYLTYLGPEIMTHSELLYRLDMSSRTYYRFRQQALTILSIRLWSAPAKDVDMWLEILTLLEGLEE